MFIYSSILLLWISLLSYIYILPSPPVHLLLFCMYVHVCRSEQSFRSLKTWYEEAKQHCQSHLQVVVVGCKRWVLPPTALLYLIFLAIFIHPHLHAPDLKSPVCLENLYALLATCPNAKCLRSKLRNLLQITTLTTSRRPLWLALMWTRWVVVRRESWQGMARMI